MHPFDTTDTITHGYWPTLSQMMASIIYCPFDHSSNDYDLDKKNFLSYKGRLSLIIRMASNTEFSDNHKFEQGQRNVPQLWVLVTRLAPGVHHVTPLWRGKPIFSTEFYPNVNAHHRHHCAELSSDSEVANIVLECHRRGGIDRAEWLSFLAETHGFQFAAQQAAPLDNSPAYVLHPKPSPQDYIASRGSDLVISDLFSKISDN